MRTCESEPSSRVARILSTIESNESAVSPSGSATIRCTPSSPPLTMPGSNGSEPRKGTDGFTYDYKEGPITFPDALDRPSRTMVTGEGGATPSRFKHVVEFKPTKGQVTRLELRNEDAMEARKRLGMGVTKWLRRLTPVELERLNGFPDNHTEGVTDGKRAFFMGNALVCGIVNRISMALGANLR